MTAQADILERLLDRAMQSSTPFVADERVRQRIEYVARCLSNRAGVRLLMACMLAKVHRPEVDPRKPYTEIGGADTFSGRAEYDEPFITPFITKYRLPCNPTTAFLTPALRNINHALTPDVEIVGRPRELYVHTLQLLHDAAVGAVSAEDALTETIRCLVLLRDERANRIAQLLEGLERARGDNVPLASEAIVKLLEQHLACRNSSRLPVLIVAAAYQCASAHLGERIKPLTPHTAADEQTGALGDVEVCLINESHVCTAYEMKSKSVGVADIDRALTKILRSSPRIDNYIFITTEPIAQEVRDYAAEVYDRTEGAEMAVLDCIGFARHFLHLFHRLRSEFLDRYQALVLAEPESAVNQPLKEAFLTLRQAAESDE